MLKRESHCPARGVPDTKSHFQSQGRMLKLCLPESESGPGAEDAEPRVTVTDLG